MSVRLSSLFGDHAVLQRDIPVPVWGWTQASRRVAVEIAGVRAEAYSDERGAFRCVLPPLAAGGPHVLRASLLQHDGRVEKTIESRDIHVGEVWLASGQSNMEMRVESTELDLQAHAREVCGTDNYPSDLRMFTPCRDPGPGEAVEVDARWEVADFESVPYFSAAAWHFALRLRRELGVAVGILHSSWGGTIIETWISRNTLAANPDRRAWLARYVDTVNSPAYWNGRVEDGLVVADGSVCWGMPSSRYGACHPDPGNEAFGRGWAAPDFDDSAWESIKLPNTWTRAGHQNNGVFWFRRVVEVPAEFAGRDLLLEPGAADKHDVAYWNGEEVGRTGQGFEEQHWSRPRHYTVPGRLVKAGKNVLAIRVFSFIFDGGLIGPKMRAVPDADVESARGDAIALSTLAERAIDLSGPWRYNIEHDTGWVATINGASTPPGPGNPNTPHLLFDRMIRPLIPYALRGAIWYQGESNAGMARWYARLVEDLARDWRFHWGQGDFPLIQVQLANFREPTDYDETHTWPYLREAQFMATRAPGIGMASAIDIGEAADIHPKNKRAVGERLAAWALAKTYGRSDIAAHGPHYAGVAVEGRALRVRFTGVEGGLCTRDGKEPRTFYVAGGDRVFFPARARIEGDTVVVESEAVDAPEAVRYAWSDNPEAANLANGQGLPASSFRSDTY